MTDSMAHHTAHLTALELSSQPTVTLLSCLLESHYVCGGCKQVIYTTLDSPTHPPSCPASCPATLCLAGVRRR